MSSLPVTFPVYLVSGRGGAAPLLVRPATGPVSVPLFSSLEAAGAFLAQSDYLDCGEIWRIERATLLKRWLAQVADCCQRAAWDLSQRHGEWRTTGAMAFGDFLAALTGRAKSEEFAAQN